MAYRIKEMSTHAAAPDIILQQIPKASTISAVASLWGAGDQGFLILELTRGSLLGSGRYCSNRQWFHYSGKFWSALQVNSGLRGKSLLDQRQGPEGTGQSWKLKVTVAQALSDLERLTLNANPPTCHAGCAPHAAVAVPVET
jgi:hypothetical protein